MSVGNEGAVRALEMKDICGYLPHGLHFIKDGEVYTPDFVNVRCRRENKGQKPILRPLSDLYQTITHGGRRFVPIVELAKTSDIIEKAWKVSEQRAIDSNNTMNQFFFCPKDGFFRIISGSNGIEFVRRQIDLFDLLHEWKIDYRDLIGAGLAVSVHDIKEAVYE